MSSQPQVQELTSCLTLVAMAITLLASSKATIFLEDILCMNTWAMVTCNSPRNKGRSRFVNRSPLENFLYLFLNLIYPNAWNEFSTYSSIVFSK